MVIIKINGQNYEACESWADITIETAARLAEIHLPYKLQETYDVIYKSGGDQDEKQKKLDAITDSMTEEDQYKHFPRFYLNCMKVLSNVPEEVLEKTDVISIKAFYFQYFQKFVEGVHFFPYDFEPKTIASFTFKDVVYELPHDKEVFGQRVPMVDISAMEFCESSDLMTAVSYLNKKKELGKLAMILAILCRPAGEQYDQDTALKRAAEFQQISMDIVWNVFFSFLVPLTLLNQFIQISTLQKEIAELNGPEKSTPLKDSAGTGKSFSLLKMFKISNLWKR